MMIQWRKTMNNYDKIMYIAMFILLVGSGFCLACMGVWIIKMLVMDIPL